MAYVFFLSGEHPNLAKAEVETLFGKVIVISSELLLLETDEIDLTLALRLAYTRRIGKVIRDVQHEEELLDLVLKNTFKITVENISGQGPTSKSLADNLYGRQTSPEVDIHHPTHHYVFFWVTDIIYVTEEIYFNDDNPHTRRSHLKLYNHPTSMHPKLARAMINLAVSDGFIDPFCGAGGLVIEGKLMGLNVQGSDISAELVGKARENAQELSVKANFTKKDALTLEEKALAIITDLPYGKNSTITEGINSLYEKFFFLAQDLTEKLVIGVANTTDIESLLGKTSWTIKNSFEIYIHKSLTRKIIVLEKN